ncbi:MAG: hypothetical protein O3B13_15310 [Planctomycetota bacterium]|nr:hypothetical protein [Planctomycetota bacterium]
MTTFRIKATLLSLTMAAFASVSMLGILRAEEVADAVPEPVAVAGANVSVSKAEPTTPDASAPETTRPVAEADAKTNPVLLRYQFRKGEFVHYEETSRSEMVLMAREQQQTMRENRRTNKHFRVVSVSEDGSAVIEPVIDRVQMEARNDEEPAVAFDSANANSEDKDFKAVQETIGRAALRIRYSASGHIEELLPVQTPGGESPEVEHPEKQNFLIAFPEEALAIGEAWDDSYLIDVSVDGKLRNPLKKRVKIRRNYTLKNVENGIAEIQFRTYPLAVERDPQVQVQLVHHSLFGMIHFDVEKGIILEWKSNGSGSVFDAFGPASSMQARSSSSERYIPAPDAIRNRPSSPARRPGPAGPQLPGTASLQ